MLIHTLELKNFRCFSHFQLSLAPRFTVLIGDNGSGKTAVLDGLAVGLGSLFLGFPEAAVPRSIHRDEIRVRTLVLGQTYTRELQFPVEVRCEGMIRGLVGTWSRELNSLDGRTTRQHATWIQEIGAGMSRVRRDGSPVVMPVLSYYGTGRLWVQRRQSSVESLPPGARGVGYLDCLNPSSNEKRLFRWFKTNELAALQKRERRHVLEAVRSTIITLVPHATGAFWDVDSDELVVDVNILGTAQRLPFHLLSDGYRNVIGMAADIAYRVATLNPHLLGDVVRETPGVVLIDEVDLHLHPNWQRIVVGKLLEAFPKVQFVGTTHSPFIIQSLHGRPETSLWDLMEKKPLAVESKSIEDIAENKQGVPIPQQSERFLTMKAAAEQYYQKLRQSQSAEDGELAQLRRELDELMMPFSDDPAFQAFLKMERTGAKID